MPKQNSHSYMDFLPVKGDPLASLPEAQPDFTKYGWEPSPMDDAPSAESFLDRSSFAERENPFRNLDRTVLLDSLLKEAANGSRS